MGKNKLPRLVQGRKPKQMTDPAKKYANSVLNGDILACKWVKLACQRHLDDLEHGHKRGLVWRPDKAARVVRFFRNKSITTPKKGGLMVTLKGSNLFPQFRLVQFAILVLLMPDIASYLVFV